MTSEKETKKEKKKSPILHIVATIAATIATGVASWGLGKKRGQEEGARELNEFRESPINKQIEVILNLLLTNDTFSLFCETNNLSAPTKGAELYAFSHLTTLLGPQKSPPTPFLNDLYESVKEFKQQEYREKGESAFISDNDQQLYDALEKYYNGKKIFTIPQGEDLNPRIAASIDDKQNYGYFSGVYIPQIEGKKKALVQGVYNAEEND